MPSVCHIPNQSHNLRYRRNQNKPPTSKTEGTTSCLPTPLNTPVNFNNITPKQVEQTPLSVTLTDTSDLSSNLSPIKENTELKFYRSIQEFTTDHPTLINERLHINYNGKDYTMTPLEFVIQINNINDLQCLLNIDDLSIPESVIRQHFEVNGDSFHLLAWAIDTEDTRLLHQLLKRPDLDLNQPFTYQGLEMHALGLALIKKNRTAIHELTRYQAIKSSQHFTINDTTSGQPLSVTPIIYDIIFNQCEFFAQLYPYNDSSARSDVLIDLNVIGRAQLLKIRAPFHDPIIDYCMTKTKLEPFNKSDYVKAVIKLIEQSDIFEQINNANGSNSMSSKASLLQSLKDYTPNHLSHNHPNRDSQQTFGDITPFGNEKVVKKSFDSRQAKITYMTTSDKHTGHPNQDGITVFEISELNYHTNKPIHFTVACVLDGVSASGNKDQPNLTTDYVQTVMKRFKCLVEGDIRERIYNENLLTTPEDFEDFIIENLLLALDSAYDTTHDFESTSTTFSCVIVDDYKNLYYFILGDSGFTIYNKNNKYVFHCNGTQSSQFGLEEFLLSDPSDLATNKCIPRPHQVFGHERELVDTYSYGHIKLAPGDSIRICTDGFSDNAKMDDQVSKALGDDFFMALDMLPSTANHDNTIDEFWGKWFRKVENKLKTIDPDQYFKSDELRQCSTKQLFDLFQTNQQTFLLTLRSKRRDRIKHDDVSILQLIIK